MGPITSTMKIFILFCFYFSSIFASTNIEVYRMFQATSQSGAFGNSRSAMSLHATTPNRAGSLTRLVVVLQQEEFTPSALKDLILERYAEGILVILRAESVVNPEFSQQWRQYETELFQMNLPAAIYFTFDSPQVRQMYERVSSLSGSFEFFSIGGYGYLLSAIPTTGEATPLTDLTSINFQGWLPARSADSSNTNANAAGESTTTTTNTNSKQTPTIAIVTHYDSYSLVPELPNQGNDPSQIVALLELARLFGRLYENPRTQGRYNLLFLLTAGGTVNYDGSRAWLNQLDTNTMENLDLVLCLDGIGKADANFYMHSSRAQAKDGKIKQLVDSFTTSAKNAGVKFNFIHKKINISDPSLAWEHEQYALRKLGAATLSQRSEPSTQLHRVSLFDSYSLSSLPRNIRYVAESLARYIYDDAHVSSATATSSFFEGSLAVDEKLISTWTQSLAKQPRIVGLMPKDSPVLNLFYKTLQEYTVESANQTFQLESEFAFYGGLHATMQAMLVKPALFDFVVLLVVVAYLFVLYVLLSGWENTMDSLKGAWNQRPEIGFGSATTKKGKSTKRQ